MKLSQEQISLYRRLQESSTASETYVFARRYGLSLSSAENVVSKFDGNVTKAIEFTEFYRDVLKRSINDYLLRVESTSRTGFSFVPREDITLEQELMNIETRFNINPARYQVEALERQGKLKEVVSKSKNTMRPKRFTFHPTDLDLESDYMARNSSHYYEHLLTKERD